MSQCGWGKPGAVIRGGWRCHRRGRGPGRPLATEPALPAHLGRRFGDGVRPWLASLQCRERSQLPPAPRAQHVPWRKAGFHFTARRKRWSAQFGPLPHSLSILPKGGRIDPTDESREAEIPGVASRTPASSRARPEKWGTGSAPLLLSWPICAQAGGSGCSQALRRGLQKCVSQTRPATE